MATTNTPFEAKGDDALAITRTFQSAVLRLRGTILAFKFAADGEHENSGAEPLFWPDLMDALTILTPDADVLDVVADELRRLQQAAAEAAAVA
ncbi:MAG: hypothetical protein J0H69_09810 [Burkholderiales bacterium]|nr:hypothetical protein [Burkholderiales bacterium]